MPPAGRRASDQVEPRRDVRLAAEPVEAGVATVDEHRVRLGSGHVQPVVVVDVVGVGGCRRARGTSGRRWWSPASRSGVSGPSTWWSSPEVGGVGTVVGVRCRRGRVVSPSVGGARRRGVAGSSSGSRSVSSVSWAVSAPSSAIVVRVEALDLVLDGRRRGFPAAPGRRSRRRPRRRPGSPARGTAVDAARLVHQLVELVSHVERAHLRVPCRCGRAPSDPGPGGNLRRRRQPGMGDHPRLPHAGGGARRCRGRGRDEAPADAGASGSDR